MKILNNKKNVKIYIYIRKILSQRENMKKKKKNIGKILNKKENMKKTNIWTIAYEKENMKKKTNMRKTLNQKKI